ncbi:hypothetical protein GCM10010276_52200 [Streptomyces longisporus]|uniref:Uncharacterized protein n=1 Tax=Streptomyces longisporus TaxID=1948 RepID=A0ABN3MME2_STRLO
MARLLTRPGPDGPPGPQGITLAGFGRGTDRPSTGKDCGTCVGAVPAWPRKGWCGSGRGGRWW